MTRPPAEITKIGYVDESGGFGQFTTQGSIQFVLFDSAEAATQALVNKDIKEYFVIPADYSSTGVINRFTTQREVTPPADIELRSRISSRAICSPAKSRRHCPD